MQSQKKSEAKMELTEFYKLVGGNYDEVMGRLRKDSLAIKYLGLFLKDTSYDDLASAVGNKDWQAGFAASHNLKGLSANLGLDDLQKVASDICENLRHGAPDDTVDAQLERVVSEYAKAKASIEQLLAE